MHQLGFEGMPRRLYPCTPSRLRTWLDCPRRYRMAYLDRPVPPKGAPWAHNSLGASVHNALAGWWRLKREERTTVAAGELLESGWITEGYADDLQSAEYLRRSRSMVERYVENLDPACEPAGVERTVAAKTDLIAISGRIDRLDDRPASATEPTTSRTADQDPYGRELVVVDYKTGRSRLSTDDARSSLALALYALAAGRVLRRPCSVVELHHVPTGEVLRWEHSPRSLERQLGRAEDIAAMRGGRRRYRSIRIPAAATRSSRPLSACGAAGATSAASAPRAGPPPRSAGRGTAWPTMPIARSLAMAQKSVNAPQ